jgi:hypothetical protein
MRHINPTLSLVEVPKPDWNHTLAEIAESPLFPSNVARQI